MSARFVCFLLLCSSLFAQQSQPSLTIYNQDFAVIRQDLPLDLKSGENQFNMNDITMHVEPDSVILRDPSGRHVINVLEQNYRNDPVSQFSLLSLYEGRTIDFEMPDHSMVKGKVIRSGFVRPDYFNPNDYGPCAGRTDRRGRWPVALRSARDADLSGSHRRDHSEAAAGMDDCERQGGEVSR